MTLEMPCIKNIKLFLELAELLEYPAEKVLLVLNKADNRLGIRVENVEENIQHKVALQIANAAHEMTLAINQGVPLVIEKRGHQTAKDVFALANLITNARAAAAKGAEKGAAKSPQERGGLFSRLMTKR
jgi:pilus assembly protein CpaE